MRDTIFALSSGAGRAGLAVFRVSGPSVCTILKNFCGKQPKPRQASLRTICDPKTGEKIDSGLILFFPGPHSYTGEDVAEFHLHGSLAVIRRFSSLLASFPGVSPAEAGAFTRRAYDNGKMDYLDLESLSDLLIAETESQRRLALDGASRLRQIAQGWREQLLNICAHTEAMLDFSEEADVDAVADTAIDLKIMAFAEEIDSYAQQVIIGNRVREGFRVALMGAPNSGKSTLLNLLANRDVAIVSQIPGTTRDILEVHLDIKGYPVCLYDTAGIRESKDEIEIAGMQRALTLVDHVDHIFWLSRADYPVDSPDKRFITVTTQIDRLYSNISSQHEKPPSYSEVYENKSSISELALSALTGEGVDAFLLYLSELISKNTAIGGAELIVSHERQAQQLRLASQALMRAFAHSHAQLELRAYELNRACQALDSLIGRIQNDDVLGAIFSRFCIGK